MNYLIEIKKKFDLHDGVIDYIKHIKDEIVVHLELLNIDTKVQEKVFLKFEGCRDIQLEALDLVDWENSSGSILTYEIFDNRFKLLVEHTNYVTGDVLYYNLDFKFNIIDIKNSR